MSKKTIKNAEAETPVPSIDPNNLLVATAYNTLSAEAKEMIQHLVEAGPGSYYKPIPAEAGSSFGKAKLHQLYLASNRKSTKSDFQPDHRTVAAAARRGFLVRETDGEKILLNEGPQSVIRDGLLAAIQE